MSYDDKIRRARELVEGHNSNVEDADKVDIDQFLDKLRKAGGTNEGALRVCSFEALGRMGMPELLAQQIAKNIFRGDSDTSSGVSSYVGPKKLAAMSIKDLLERYDPKDDDSPVAKKLSSLAKKSTFIVFNDDGSLDKAASEKLLNELRETGVARSIYVADGMSPREVFKVGDKPNTFAEKNPLYKGRLLYPDGTCDQTNRSWKGVPLEVKQLIYLATRVTHEITDLTKLAAETYIDKAVDPGQQSGLHNLLQQASIELKRLHALGEAPTLKVPRQQVGNGNKRTNQPFAAHKEF
tara:strand:- start:10295 stop:11179 length:885 start_codon:yes stop_codon:yes gene_type:complete